MSFSIYGYNNTTFSTAGSPKKNSKETTSETTFNTIQWRIQDFPEVGGANSPGGRASTYDFAKFSQKLHEIKRIWTPGGRPLRSATVIGFASLRSKSSNQQ